MGVKRKRNFNVAVSKSILLDLDLGLFLRSSVIEVS